MNRIFWCQSPTSDGESLYNIDGSISEFSNSPQQIEAFSKLKTAANWYQVCQKPDIYIRHNKGIMINSHLQSTDDIHRRIAYMFYSSEYSNASQVLKEYAAMCNLETTQDDLIALDNAVILYKKHIQKIIIVGTILLTILIVLTILTI